ncbi:HAD family hydrolase [Streptomyces sp. NPDC059446]|uniref:HAD family hydrolase n=1 Tax=Streptomyces sp. NPDC059446 TaxID=3346833 RepID=UPI0036AE001D
MIKAVLFDYGGVLSPGGTFRSHALMLSDRLGTHVPAELIEDLHRAFRMGGISTAAFVASVHERTPRRKRSLDEQSWNWPDLLRRHERVYCLAHGLRSRGVRTGILSNVWPPLADALAQAGAYEGFDPVVLSCEAGYAKPDPVIFHLALGRLGLAADDVLFVDDQPRHLAAAAGVGMRTLLATDERQLGRDLVTLLGLPELLEPAFREPDPASAAGRFVPPDANPEPGMPSEPPPGQ